MAQHFMVGQKVMPANVQDASFTLHMKEVQSSPISVFQNCTAVQVTLTWSIWKAVWRCWAWSDSRHDV